VLNCWWTTPKASPLQEHGKQKEDESLNGRKRRKVLLTEYLHYIAETETCNGNRMNAKLEQIR